MANNRMVLICNVCNPKDWQYHQPGVLVLAKWYPSNAPIGEVVKESGAYYRNDDGKNMGEEFTKFLREHSHEELASMHYTKGAGQENPVRLEYESDGLPLLEPNPPVTESI